MLELPQLTHRSQFVDYDSVHRDEFRRSRWYFPGLASATAACFTHPLELMKVYRQTKVKGQAYPEKRILKIFKKIVQKEGPRGLYFGISAAMFRQMTYLTSRFNLYEGFKKNVNGPMSFCDIVSRRESSNMQTEHVIIALLTPAAENPFNILKNCTFIEGERVRIFLSDASHRKQ